MSGITGASTTGGTTTTVGDNLAPITVPGIASGIDYSSIITKLTSLTLAPNTQYNNQITQLNAKNAELIKINSLLASVQNTIAALSDPQTFNAYSGTSTDSIDASVTQLPSGTPTPGSYTIAATQIATSTTITGASAVGVSINPNLPLICAGTSITATNGDTGQQGLITVDGVSVTYDVTSQSLNQIVANINLAVQSVDPGFSITAGANGAISISSTDQQISLGSSGDRGNLEQVLKLDVAQINNVGPPYTVTSAGPIGGVNEATSLATAGNAGFATAITSGTFTINGVQISVAASNDNVASVLAKINNSTAGVVASFDITTDTFSLSNKGTGAQSIVVGSSKDTSNFLKAADLVPGSGATTTVGRQAYVAVRTASGGLQTTYSNSDAVAGAIPGIAINVSGSTTIPFTVTVAQDPSNAIAAITNFVSAYNAALNEIALATAPPVVQQTSSSTTGTTSSSSVLASGGVLYGDQTVQAISSRLTELVSSISNNGSSTYNSLQSVGLSLDTSHTVYQSNTDSYGGTVDSTTTGAISTSSADGTDGQLQPLDIAAFTAAFAADPSAVAGLFTSTAANGSLTSAANQSNGLSYQLGSYLTEVTGSPTALANGIVGDIPVISLLQGDENAQTAEITALNLSIKNTTAKANAQASDRERSADLEVPIRTICRQSN